MWSTWLQAVGAASSPPPTGGLRDRCRQCHPECIFRHRTRADVGAGLGSSSGPSPPSWSYSLYFLPHSTDTPVQNRTQPRPRPHPRISKERMRLSWLNTTWPSSSANAVITSAGADITIQEEHIQNDVTTYNNNEAGNGCSGNESDFASCLAGEQQTAQGDLVQENVAARAEKADVTEQIRSVQQIETAIAAFIQQLDGIPWSSSVLPVLSKLTHALTDDGTTYQKVATDLAGGKPFSADSQSIAVGGVGSGHPVDQYGLRLGYTCSAIVKLRPVVVRSPQHSANGQVRLDSYSPWAPSGSLHPRRHGTSFRSWNARRSESSPGFTT